MDVAEKEDGINPIDYIRQHRYMQPYLEIEEIIGTKPIVTTMQYLWKLKEMGVMIWEEEKQEKY